MEHSENRIPTMQDILDFYVKQPEVYVPEPTLQEKSIEIAKQTYPMRKSNKTKAAKKEFSLSVCQLPPNYFGQGVEERVLEEKLDPIFQKYRDIYVRIELTNKPVSKDGYADQAYHYIPFNTLGQLFQLYNAILNDSLIVHHIKLRHFPCMDMNVDESLLEGYRQHFQDGKPMSCYHHVHCREIRPGKVPKPMSIFGVDYCPWDSNGKASSAAWKLRCETMYFRSLTEEEQLMEEYQKCDGTPVRAVFDDNACRSTELRIPEEDLLGAIESIYDAVCKLLCGKLALEKRC